MANEQNLRPWKPGESGNPAGINQYTYRRDFERAVDRLLASEYSPRHEPVPEGECLKARCLLCGGMGVDVYVGEGMTAHESCAAQVQGLSRGEVIALTTVQRAMQGDERMLPEVLKRLWPGVERHEHAFDESAGPVSILDRLADLAQRRRANGDGREPEPEREDRTQ